MNTENNLGSIISVVVVGVVAITSLLFGGKEITNNRIEIVDKTTIDRSVDKTSETAETATNPDEILGGLVHNVKEIFAAGLTLENTLTAVDATLSSTLTIGAETQADRIVSGGDVTIIGYGTTTATAAEICDNAVIQIGLLTDDTASLTLPATTTLHADCLGANGKGQTILVQNIATSTMAMTIVAGAGIDLQEPVGGDIIVDELEYARIDFVRLSSATSTAEVNNYRVAD